MPTAKFVRLRLLSRPVLLPLDLLPAGARPTARALSVISHGEFRRLLRQIALERPVMARVDTPPVQNPPRQAPATLHCSTGWSRPLHADHAELATAKAATRLVAHARRRSPAPSCTDRFSDGMEVLKYGTELHLASFCLADAELRLAGAGDPAFAALQYADVPSSSRRAARRCCGRIR
jgi:hypothetical protein